MLEKMVPLYIESAATQAESSLAARRNALREAAGGLVLEQHWDRLVARRTGEDFAETQLRLAEAAAKAIGAAERSS